VTLGDPQVAMRHVVRQRALAHEDRRGRAAPAGRDEHPAEAYPGDRLRLAGQCHRAVADHQVLHRRLAAVRRDARAAAEA
jgi:hypothetical protein